MNAIASGRLCSDVPLTAECVVGAAADELQHPPDRTLRTILPRFAPQPGRPAAGIAAFLFRHALAAKARALVAPFS